MPQAALRIFESLEESSRAAAARFAELAATTAGQGRNFSCALSGGKTPRRLYELLAEPQLSIPWQRVELFQVDERAVAPDDPESNYRMIREALLSRVPLPETNFHRLAGERADLDAATKEYAGELGKVLQPKPGDFPRFDLVFLGMGADGHTASLFPSSAALDERELWVRPNYSPRLGKYRLTLTFPVLNAAAEIILLVSGGDKAETLRQVLEGPQGVYPVQGIHPGNGRMSCLVDKAAAALLGERARSGS
jgi:6-phosphogluconolactonase